VAAKARKTPRLEITVGLFVILCPTRAPRSMQRMTTCPQVRVSYGIFSGFLQSPISFQFELSKFRRFAAELALAGGCQALVHCAENPI
jgi:hypothetical protein